MGSIVFIDKDKADKLKALGFNYTINKSTNGQNMYSFVDNIELRKVLGTQFSANDFVTTSTVNL